MAVGCSSVVKIPAECFVNGLECFDDKECGAGAMCNMALSTPKCIKTGCEPEGALCSNDKFCAQGLCTAGVCTTQAATCSGSGMMECSGTCVDTNVDPANCGACGQAVPDGTTCVNGAVSCGSSTIIMCNGSCLDVSADPQNCGSCGRVCPSTFMCNGPAGPAQCSKTVNTTQYESCNDACAPYSCYHAELHYTTSTGSSVQTTQCDVVASPPAQATSFNLICTCISF